MEEDEEDKRGQDIPRIYRYSRENVVIDEINIDKEGSRQVKSSKSSNS
jgi:hypothetical protein